MQKFTMAVIGAASLLALPAFAQTTTPSPNSSQASNGSSSHPMNTADMQKVQQKITQDLKNDGFTNIKVIPDSFLVHATNKQNEPVVMIINPNSVFAVTAIPNQANAGNPSGTHGSNQGVGSSGTNTPSKQ